MSLVSVVLLCIFLAVNYSVQRSIEAISRQVLYQVIQDEGVGYFSDAERPDIAIFRGQERVLLPYFTVNVWPQNGIAYVTGGTYSNLEDTEVLQDILSACLRQEEDEGTIPSYGLRYLRQNNGAYEKIAFVDMSMEQAMLRRTLLSYLPIALGAFLLLLAASVLLSRWATVPVERAWKAQRQFLSDASHELKTPLTVILSNAELLESAQLDGRSARWADNMSTAPVFSQVSLSDTAEDCVLAFEPVAYEAGKPLVYDIAPDVLVQGDGDRLRQLVSILLDNAIKYGADGGTITLSVQKLDRQARLTVSNPGEPIPPEKLSHLFERFYRADDSRGEKSGFGLGLAIAENIASIHKGTLRAESDAVSTRFIFTMPLRK